MQPLPPHLMLGQAPRWPDECRRPQWRTLTKAVIVAVGTVLAAVSLLIWMFAGLQTRT